jgi:hypothetical protein
MRSAIAPTIRAGRDDGEHQLYIENTFCDTQYA